MSTEAQAIRGALLDAKTVQDSSFRRNASIREVIWQTIRLAAVLFTFWSVASVSAGAYVPGYACAADTAPTSSRDGAPSTLPIGPQPQLEGQHSEQREQLSINPLKAVGATVLGDIAYLATAPLRMDFESGLITAGVVGVVGGVMVADSSIQKWAQKNRTQ